MDEYEQALADEGYEDEPVGSCPRCFVDLDDGSEVCATCREELLAEAAEYQADDDFDDDDDWDDDEDFDDEDDFEDDDDFED